VEEERGVTDQPLRRHVRRTSGGEPRAGAANEICSKPRDSGAGLAGVLQRAAHGTEREEEEEELRSREHMPPRPPSGREHPRLPTSNADEARGHRGVGVWCGSGTELDATRDREGRERRKRWGQWLGPLGP
jgi:hypothetical protein